MLGLKEGGVDWALDKDNEKLVTPEMKAKVDAAKADIISGKITVHDYMSNNACKCGRRRLAMPCRTLA